MFTLLQNGNILSPNDIGRHDLLLCDDKIVKIGKNLSGLANILQANILDVEGKTVIPGFIDQHVHYLGGGDAFGPAGATTDLIFTDLTTAGITTAVGCLGIEDKAKNLRDLVRRAQDFERLGITTYVYTGSFNVPPPTLTGDVQSDFILVDKVIGVKMAISEPFATLSSAAQRGEVAKSAILGAMIAGKKGVVHLHVGRKPERLEPLFNLLEVTGLPVTYFVPTHINRSEVDVIAESIRFLRMGGTVDLTANMYFEAGHLTGIRPDLALQEFLKAGISIDQITMSSDGNVSMPRMDSRGIKLGLMNLGVNFLPRMLSQIVETCGIPFSEVLKIVTSNVARVLGIEHRKGSIGVGMDADLVVWGSNQTIEMVLARGRILVQEGRAIIRNQLDPPPLQLND